MTLPRVSNYIHTGWELWLLLTIAGYIGIEIGVGVVRVARRWRR